VSKVTRKRTLRHASVSSAIAPGMVATDVGVANASTRATAARVLTSVTANAKGNHSSSTPMPPGMPGGVGGDVSATAISITDPRGTTTTYDVSTATTVTKNEQSATLADVLIGDNVRIAVRSTDPTLADTIDIVPASVVGKVTAINDDVLTIAGPNATTGSVDVSSGTAYMKGGANASLGDISVGTAIFAQGSFGSSAMIIDATTVGMGGPGGPPPRPRGPGFGAPSSMKGTVN
jgi:hypothetical protein